MPFSEAELCELVGERAYMARISAEIIERYAATGDHVGLGFQVPRIVAQVKAMLAVVNDLRAMKRAETEQEAPDDRG